jgi:hypothetical protein
MGAQISGDKGFDTLQKRLNNEKKRNQGKWIILAIIAAVLLMLLLLRSCHTRDINSHHRGQEGGDTVGVQVDTMVNTGDTLSADSLSYNSGKTLDSIFAISDTVMRVKREKKRKKIQVDSVGILKKLQSDSSLQSMVKQDTLVDTASAGKTVKSDTIVAEHKSPCDADTSELWVYPDPSGGLHRLLQKIHFYSNRPCKIFWRNKGSVDWIEYDGSEIVVSVTSTLQFSGVDTCGREMEAREEYYEIEQDVKTVCPQGMAHVQVGEASYCVDIYEWPNRRGARPVAYVSLYQASDSCFSVGKRLCTADEWLLACSGPYSTAYPYGNSYEERACATADTLVHKSGDKVECRSYFGLYDMSGNLQEWTDTRASENDRFNYVAGGFWNSGIKSSCRERRYSYYSQNRHNPVGFRCCQSIGNSTQRRKK